MKGSDMGRGLSELQKRILRLAYETRQLPEYQSWNNAIDITHQEVIISMGHHINEKKCVAEYGDRAILLKNDGRRMFCDGIRIRDPNGRPGIYFCTPERKRERLCQSAAVSRAITRLVTRGLMEYVLGAGGYILTDAGIDVAKGLMVNEIILSSC